MARGRHVVDTRKCALAKASFFKKKKKKKGNMSADCSTGAVSGLVMLSLSYLRNVSAEHSLTKGWVKCVKP